MRKKLEDRFYKKIVLKITQADVERALELRKKVRGGGIVSPGDCAFVRVGVVAVRIGRKVHLAEKKTRRKLGVFIATIYDKEREDWRNRNKRRKKLTFLNSQGEGTLILGEENG